MSDEVLVTYERGGGRVPSDDESLIVRASGAFEARRTVGGKRVGRFAGELDAPLLRRLAAAARKVATADDLSIPTPRDGATETIDVEGRHAELGSNEQPAAPWKELVKTLRAALDEGVVESPVAVLELRAATSHATLEHVGTEPLAVDAGSIAVRLVRLASTGVPLAQWTGGASGEDASHGTGSWVDAGPGWSVDLPFQPQELGPDESLQVWLTARVRDGELSRLARLFASVPGGR